VGGRLTTHVLDTSQGRPAAGLQVELVRVHGDHTHRLALVTTNSDGRCDRPLLEGTHLQAGAYELRFDVGGYFSAQGMASERPFLGVVPVRFEVSEPETHYHVPLLVSPYGYSTYRGS